MWFKYNMNIEFPWKIIKSDIWDFSGNNLKVNINNILEKSKQENILVF